MSFGNLKTNADKLRQQQNPIADDKAIKVGGQEMHDAFDQNALDYQWTGMCIRMQQNKAFIGLGNRMKSITPKLLDFPNIEIVVDNQLLLDDMQAIKNRIRNTLVQALHNADLTVNYRLAANKEVKKILNKKELLESMRQKNAALDKLCNHLKLIMS